MDNEKGYTLPMIMILSAALCFITIATAERFSGEKAFYKAVEERLVADHLLRLALADLDTGLDAGQIMVQETGSFSYPKGKVAYRTTKRNEESITIALSAVTINSRKKEASVYYDTVLEKVVEWVEK